MAATPSQPSRTATACGSLVNQTAPSATAPPMAISHMRVVVTKNATGGSAMV